MGKGCETPQGAENEKEFDPGRRKFVQIFGAGTLAAVLSVSCGEPEENSPADAGNKPDTALPDKGGKKDGNIPISDDVSLPPDKGIPDHKPPDSQVPDKRKPDAGIADKGADQKVPDKGLPPDQQMPDKTIPDSTLPKLDAVVPDQKPPDLFKPDLDVTPPPAPVITTNNGLPWDPGKSDITIEGTCDTGDTFKMQVRDNKTDPTSKGKSTTPPWVDITYNAGTGKWSYPTKVSPYDPHWFEFRALDKANNASDSDVLFVELT